MGKVRRGEGTSAREPAHPGGGWGGGGASFSFLSSRVRACVRGEKGAAARDATRRGAARDRGSPGGRTLCCPRFCVRACSTRSNRPHWSWYPPVGFSSFTRFPRRLGSSSITHSVMAKHNTACRHFASDSALSRTRTSRPTYEGWMSGSNSTSSRSDIVAGGEGGSPAGARGELEENVSFVTPSISRAWAARRETGYRS